MNLRGHMMQERLQQDVNSMVMRLGKPSASMIGDNIDVAVCISF